MERRWRIFWPMGASVLQTTAHVSPGYVLWLTGYSRLSDRLIVTSRVAPNCSICKIPNWIHLHHPFLESKCDNIWIQNKLFAGSFPTLTSNVCIFFCWIKMTHIIWRWNWTRKSQNTFFFYIVFSNLIKSQ